MRFVDNSGNDRVIDLIRSSIGTNHDLGCVTPSFSLFAFAAMADALRKASGVRIVLPSGDDTLAIFGAEGDRSARNRLQVRWLALQCANWLSGSVELRRAGGAVPQGA